MAYTQEEQKLIPSILGTHTANFTSESTYLQSGQITVTGDFTATVQFEVKSYGDADNEGAWAVAGRITSEDVYQFRMPRGKPVRYSVVDFIDGEVVVCLEQAIAGPDF